MNRDANFRTIKRVNKAYRIEDGRHHRLAMKLTKQRLTFQDFVDRCVALYLGEIEPDSAPVVLGTDLLDD